jgi:hypothetical protein
VTAAEALVAGWVILVALVVIVVALNQRGRRCG